MIGDIGGSPVVVHQMGKVGSVAVFNALNRLIPGQAHSSHKFSHNAEVRQIERETRDLKKPLVLISLVREPVGRNVAMFFENILIHTKCPDFVEGRFTIEELRNRFISTQCPEDSYALTWFDVQMRDKFGIDVYQEPFPKTGWHCYFNGNTSLLVMKSALPDWRKEEVLESYLGINPIEIFRDNVGVEKFYAQSYREFLGTVRLPREYLDLMLGSRYARHFFSEVELQKVKEKWL